MIARTPWQVALAVAVALVSLATLAAPEQRSEAGAAALPAAELDITRAVAQVLARDPQVRAARATLAGARAQSGVARSRLWPSAGLSASEGRSSDEDLGVPVDRRTTTSQAYLRWNLFNGFSDRAELDASTQEAEAAQADLRAAVDEAVDRSVRAYFDVLRLQMLARLSAQRRADADELLSTVRRQIAAGKAADNDAELSSASVIEARIAEQVIGAELGAARIRLQTLLGAPFGRLSEALPTVADAEDLPFDELLQHARQHNAQWRAAQLRAQAMHLRIGPTVAPEYLPRLDLDVRKRLGGASTPPALTSSISKRGWTMTLTYEVPLGGGADARRDAATHRAEAAQAESQRIGDAVRDQLGEVQHNARQAGLASPQLERQVEHMNAAVRASSLLWDAGRRSLQQLIELRDARFAAQQRQSENQLRLVTERTRLRLLTGQLGEEFGAAALR